MPSHPFRLCCIVDWAFFKLPAYIHKVQHTIFCILCIIDNLGFSQSHSTITRNNVLHCSNVSTTSEYCQNNVRNSRSYCKAAKRPNKFIDGPHDRNSFAPTSTSLPPVFRQPRSGLFTEGLRNIDEYCFASAKPIVHLSREASKSYGWESYQDQLSTA